MVKPVDSALKFAALVADALSWTQRDVEDFFDVGEDRDGYFYAALRGSKWLKNVEDFKTVCSLAKDLGGEYVEGQRVWRVPGPAARGQQKPTEQPQKVPEKPLVEEGEAEVFESISVDRLTSMDFPTRISYDDETISVLAATFKTFGVMQPLLVRPARTEGWFEVVAGERRLRAARKVGFAKVPCNIRRLTDQQAFETALVENVQRQDLSDYEVARWLGEMTRRFGYTQEQLAEKVGKSQQWVSQHLAMLNLEEDSNITRVVELSKISEGHAREILAAPPEKRAEVAKQVATYMEEEGTPPPVREIRKFVHPEVAPTPSEPTMPKPKPRPIDIGLEIRCGECGETFTLIHVANNLHRLQKIRVVEQ